MVSGRSSGFPALFSSLPITIHRSSGIQGLKENEAPNRATRLFGLRVLVLFGAGWGYSGGTAPDFHGIPY